MGVNPPYFFNRGARGLSVRTDVTTATVEITVRGRWSHRLGADVLTGIRKCLAERPSVIIADVRGLADSDGNSAPMWLAMRRMCISLQPPVKAALCVAPDAVLSDRLSRLGAGKYLPMYGSLETARARMTSPLPATDVLQAYLPPDLISAGMARDLVGQGCRAWGLPGLQYPARNVMSELVTNAVEHARSDLVVTVARRVPGLYLSVRDGHPHLPRLSSGPDADDRPGSARGQGLRLVDEQACAWGALPSRDGKVVWATLRSPREAGP
jgi:hypothetical protein